MADDYTISYSYRWGDTPGRRPRNKPQTPPEEPQPDSGDLYAYAGGPALDLPDGNVLISDPYSENRLLASRDVSIALEFCREYRTLSQHAEHLVSFMRELGNDAEAVRRVLAAIQERGLMLSATQTWQKIANRGSRAAGAAPSRVFVITCDRPEALKRVLESTLQNASLANHEKMFVIDDSRNAGHAQSNRELAEQLSLSSPRDIEYVGADEQRTLLEQLICALPQHEAGIRFLFDREQWREVASYGLARNFSLLLSIGRRALVMDDDVLCTALAGAHHRDGISFIGGQPEADFYPDAGHWQQSAARKPFDPLTGHLQCLGLELAEALYTLSPGSDSTSLDRAQGKALLPLHGGSRVLVTECGSYGDPGTGNNSWVYSLGAESLQRAKAAGGINAALAKGNCWLGRYRPTFSAEAVMSQITGLDNSAFLPPYFPAHRGEDALFGAMTRYLQPDSIALEYDWAVPHLPLENRSYASTGTDALQSGAMMLCADLVRERSEMSTGTVPEDRLRELAGWITGLAGLPLDKLSELYRRESMNTRVDKIRFLTRNLQLCTDAPADWRQQVEEQLRGAVQALQNSERLAGIRGLPPGMDEAELGARFSRYAGGFGAALLAWPAIRETAAGTFP